jgi:hypothetical protein
MRYLQNETVVLKDEMNAGIPLNTKNSISPSILGNFNLGEGSEP